MAIRHTATPTRVRLTCTECGESTSLPRIAAEPEHVAAFFADHWECIAQSAAS